MDFGDVIATFEKFNSGDREAFFEAEKLKNAIVLHKTNIWFLLPNINNQEINSQLQLFIIKLINDILKSNFSSLPLYEIFELLNQIFIQSVSDQTELNENVVNSLIDLIGLFKFTVYVIDDHLCFNLESSDNLQLHQIISFLKYFNSPPEFIEEAFKEKKCKEKLLNGYFKPLLFYIFGFIEKKSGESVLLLSEFSLLLLAEIGEKSDIDSEILPFFLTAFQNEVLNNSLQQIFVDCEPYISSSIFDLLSNSLRILQLTLNANRDIYENIFNVLFTSFSNHQKILNEENVIISFCNFMANFPIDKLVFDNCENFSNNFIRFLHQVISENYFVAIRILSSSSDFLYNVYDYIPQDSDIYSSYIHLFETFFNSTFESINSDPLLIFNSLFNGENELKTTKKILISLIQASENIIEENMNLLMNNFNSIIHDEFKLSLNCDVKMCFLIFIGLIITKYDFVVGIENYGANLMNLFFKEFVESQKNIESYKDDSTVYQIYPSELMIIHFLEMFIKKYMYNKQMKELCPIVPLTPFPEYNSLIVFIFDRLWSDVVFEIHFKKASDVLNLFLCYQNAIEILATTNHFQYFFDNYSSFPAKYIVFKTIAKISFQNGAFLDFLKKIHADLFNRFDDPSVNLLFKILSAFVSNTPSVNIWRNVYFAFYAHFLPKCDPISNNPNKKSQKFLLKFLLVFIQSAPQNAFKAFEPHSFNLFNMVIHLLINVSNSLLMVDENKNENENEDDEKWNNVELILKIFTLALRSPFSNYEIMKFYGDQNVIRLFQMIILLLNNRTLEYSDRPQLIYNLSCLLNSFSKYFIDELAENGEFWNFFIYMTKFILSSSFPDSINMICQALSSLLERYSALFRNHFVLALDALSRNENTIMAAGFLVDFYRVDRNFVLAVGNLIESFLGNEYKSEFNNIYSKVWECVDKNENKLSKDDVNFLVYKKIHNIQVVWHDLPCLENCFKF